MNYMKVFCITIVILFLIPSITIAQNNIQLYAEQTLPPQMQSTFLNDSEKINEYTWSIMRYDHPQNSINFGLIETPKPSTGVILIPTDIMSVDLCKVAVQMFNDDRMKTLQTLVSFDKENMRQTTQAMIPGYTEWNAPLALMFANRKEAAHEMFYLGRRCIRGTIVGDCYAQASFNTAVLRLCGFTPEEVFNVKIPGHVINAINVGEKWYVLDSTQDAVLYDFYNFSDTIRSFENDRYYVCFGDSLWNYSNNMNDTLLHTIIGGILQVFGNPKLGNNDWNLDEFIQKAEPDPNIANISLFYTVKDAIGETIEEKSEFLAQINHEFITNHTNPNNELPNQYNRALYAYGLID
ncbi:MAG: hypothetical protein NT038_09130, partial [Euryarchaeota archaeon]|nr:hypothetical protein [Euryarchaeota archaeon]